MPDWDGSLFLLPLPIAKQEFVGLCQLESSSRVSVRERCAGRSRGPCAMAGP